MKRIFLFVLLLFAVFSISACFQGTEELEEFTVVFDANSGTTVEALSVKEIADSPKTQRDGYEFGGWYYDPEFCNPVVFPVQITQDVTLYAQWTPLYYDVTFDAQGGSSVESIYVNEIAAPPTTKRSGYQFDGWYYDAKFSSPVIFPVEIKQDTTLYAKWIQTHFKVIFNTNGGSSLSNRTTRQITKSPVTKRENYRFDGWYYDKNFRTPVVFPLSVERNMTLYAKWVQTHFDITFNTNGGTSINPQTTSEIKTMPVTQRDNYCFDGWYYDEDFRTPVVFPLSVERNMTLYAKWVQTHFDITFNTNGGTSINPQTTNEINTMPVTQRDNYYFDGWYYDEDFRTPVVFPLEVKRDMTLYAKWIRLQATYSYESFKIKHLDSSYYSSYKLNLEPDHLELAKLKALGYKIRITVEYDVYYRKDYDVPLDLGYAGSPKYEVSINNRDELGVYKNDLSTTTYRRSYSVSYSVSIAALEKDAFWAQFSTNNVQNIICFENVKVTFECYK